MKSVYNLQEIAKFCKIDFLNESVFKKNPLIYLEKSLVNLKTYGKLDVGIEYTARHLQQISKPVLSSH